MKKLRNNLLAVMLLAVAGTTVPVKNVSAMKQPGKMYVETPVYTLIENLNVISTQLGQPESFTNALSTIENALNDSTVIFEKVSTTLKDKVLEFIKLAMENIQTPEFKTQENVESLIELLQTAQNKLTSHEKEITTFLEQAKILRAQLTPVVEEIVEPITAPSKSWVPSFFKRTKQNKAVTQVKPILEEKIVSPITANTDSSNTQPGFIRKAGKIVIYPLAHPINTVKGLGKGACWTAKQPVVLPYKAIKSVLRWVDKNPKKVIALVVTATGVIVYCLCDKQIVAQYIGSASDKVKETMADAWTYLSDLLYKDSSDPLWNLHTKGTETGFQLQQNLEMPKFIEMPQVNPETMCFANQTHTVFNNIEEIEEIIEIPQGGPNNEGHLRNGIISLASGGLLLAGKCVYDFIQNINNWGFSNTDFNL